MLTIEDFDAYYGESQALRSFSVSVSPGEIVCLMGRNGAGKTTALKAIMGLLPPRRGRRFLAGRDRTNMPAHAIPTAGIGYVPQGRRLFSELTVQENLTIGLMTRKSGPEALDQALSHFPVLRERLGQRAGTLSGGEQSMLAVARALCTEPSILMLDEPTEGLMPSMVATIRDVVRQLRESGVGILLVEQRAETVLTVADRILFMDRGEITATFSGEAVRADPQVLKAHLGVGQS
jgi:branched-chain amino acid transport system ATP-binding protein